MDILTLDDFRRYCKESGFTKVIYSTENNPEAFFAPLRVSLVFDTVIVTNGPEVHNITLKASTGTLTFENVQKVRLDRRYSLVNTEGKPCGWDIARITCNPWDGGKAEIHTLLIDF